MKQKIISFILTLSMLCAFMPVGANAASYSSYENYKYGDYLAYGVNNNEVTITDCNPAATEIEIPREINGFPVTSISEGAFNICGILTSVTIPDSVARIGGGAFFTCRGLKSITIPDGVTSIDERTFGYCIELTSVTIPKSVTSIKSEAFNRCDALTDVYYNGTENEWNKINIEIGNDELKKAAIHYNSVAPTVKPTSNTLKDLRYEDLYYKVINNTITITDCEMTALNVDIPREINGLPVTSIGDNAFYSSPYLIKATIPEGVTSIGKGAFGNCIELIDITIPSSVTSIGEFAFDNCRGLTNVIIPDNVKKIGIAAFSSCKGLTNITIPKSVTIIDDCAFMSCDALTGVNYGGTKDDWNKISIRNFNDKLKNAAIRYNSVGEASNPTVNPTITPVEKPIENPVEKPIENPVVSPIESPVEKPIENPVVNPTINTQSSNEISVIVDNNPIAFDVPPMIMNGRTMVPMRAIFEALGAVVNWNDLTQTVTALKDRVTVEITLNSYIMHVNGNAVSLELPACIVNDRLLVPVRAVSEVFKTRVDWNDSTRSVIITSVNDEVPPQNNANNNDELSGYDKLKNELINKGTYQEGMYYAMYTDDLLEYGFMYDPQKDEIVILSSSYSEDNGYHVLFQLRKNENILVKIFAEFPDGNNYTLIGGFVNSKFKKVNSSKPSLDDTAQEFMEITVTVLASVLRDLNFDVTPSELGMPE